MTDHPISTPMPASWWRPASRPSTPGLLSLVLFYGLFIVGLPFAVGGWYRFGLFRVPGRLAELAGRIFGRHINAALDVNGIPLEFPLLDRFWSRLIFRTYSYEPELKHLLESLKSREFDLFLDAGANIGLWSVSAVGSASKVIAVEASPAVLEALRRNRANAAGRFEIRASAIWSRAGETLSFTWSSLMHAGSALSSVLSHAASDSTWSKVAVQTSTIDGIMGASGVSNGSGLVVVKLDVEGAEREALNGAASTLASDRTILVYEEHGRDRTHAVTRDILGRGLSVFHLGPGGLRPINCVADLSPIVRLRYMGYNLFAVREGGPAASALRAIGSLPAGA